MADPRIAQARAAGYSEQEIVDFLAAQGRPQVTQAREQGYSDAEILTYLDRQSAPQERGRNGLSAGLSDAWQSLTAGLGGMQSGGAGLARMADDIPVLGPLGEWIDQNILGYDQDRESAEGRALSERAVSRMSPERRAEREEGNISVQNTLHGLLESVPAMTPAIAGGVATALATKNPSLALSVASGVEGAQAAGSTNEDIYQTLRSQGYSEEDARRAALLPSLGSGVTTGLVGRYLMPGFETKLFGNPLDMTLLKGLGQGALSEGVEEGVQSGSQQLFSNIGVGSLDETRGLFDNVGQSALHGAVIGAAGGAAFGGVSGLAGDLSRRQPRADEVARGRGATQLQDDIMMSAMEGAENSRRASAIRAAQVQPSSTVTGSLTDQSALGLRVPPIPAPVRQAVDQVTWREQVAPILDEMAMGNYDALLADQQAQQELIQKRKGQKKKAPTPFPDPVVPRPESQLTPDPFTPEMGAELIRSAEAGPMTASMLKDKGIPKPKETLQILERRGFLKKTGAESKQVKGKTGKSRTVSEPIYESTAVKSPEVARAGETTELSIKPVAVQTPAEEGRPKGPNSVARAQRTTAARGRVADLRRQLVSLPQIGEDWTQSRIDAMDSRRSALEGRLQQAEFDVAQAETGRAGWAVVERIGGPKLDGRQGLDFVQDPTGAVRESVLHTFPTRKEAENWVKAKQGQSEVPSAPKDPNASRNARIHKKLKGQLDQLGLGEKAQLKLSAELGQLMDGEMVDPEGYAETAERDAEGRSAKMLIAMARDIFDPSLSESELLDRLSSTLNHEAIHAIRSLGLFKPEEWNVLARETRSLKRKDRDYTYLQWAHETYKDVYVKDGKPDMDLIVEEAVAEMFKDWRAAGSKVGARYTGLLNKIEKFLRALLKQMTAQGVLAKVDSGEVGSRDTQSEAVKADIAGPPGVPADRRFMFAGVKSNRPPIENYNDFLTLTQEGEAPAKIYHQTGWYVGKDGEERYEISDDRSFFKESPRAYLSNINPLSDPDPTVGDVLVHPELYEAYPIIKDILLIPDIGLQPHNAGLVKSWFSKAGYGITFNPEGRDDILRSVMLHEIQHFIQFHEDWAVGGNDRFAAVMIKFDPNSRRVYEAAKAEQMVMAKSDMTIEEFARALHFHESEDARQLPLLHRYRDMMIKGEPESGAAEAYEEFLDKIARHEVYRRLEGEAEARNTQRRMDMSEADRRRTEPWRTADVQGKRGIVVRAQDMDMIAEQAAQAEGDQRFSMGPRLRNLEGAVPGVAAMPDGGGSNHAMIGRYTVVQDALARGMRVNPWKSADPLAERDKVDRATTLMQDRIFPVRRLVSESHKLGREIKDSSDPILAETLYPRRVQHRLDKVFENLFRPAFIAIDGIGATKTELSQLAKHSPLAALELESSHVPPSQAMLNLYLMARHAPERNAFIERVRKAGELDPETGQISDEPMKDGSGMTDEEAGEIMAWFGRYPKLAKVKLAAMRSDAIIAYTRKVREDSGLAPKWEEIDSPLIPKFEHYVPLRGVAMGDLIEDWDDPAIHARTGKGFKIGGREDPRMKGRHSYAGDVMAHIVLQANEALVRAEKNRVGQSFANFVRENQGEPGFTVRELAEPPKMRTVDPRTGKVRMSNKDVSKDPNYFTVKENGQLKIFEINDKGLADSLSHIRSFDDGPANRFLLLIAPGTRALSVLQTSLNPNFLFPNLMRDIATAAIQSLQYARGQEVKKDGKSWAERAHAFSAEARAVKAAKRLGVGDLAGSISAKAAKYAVRSLKMNAAGQADPELQSKMDRLGELGGLTGTYGLKTIHDQIAEINRELDEISAGPQGKKGAINGSKNAIRLGMKYLERVNDGVEGATRLAVFETFLENGWSEARAAQAAKEMTVNFNRKGEWGPGFNAAYMFFNAGTQGTTNMVQGLVGSKYVRRAALGLVLAGAVQELLMDLISPEDEYGNKLYDKIEPYVLEKNIVIMTDDEGGYRKVPLPLGYNIFHNAGRQMARVYMGKQSPLGAGASMASASVSAFNPFGQSSNLVTQWIPSVFRPLAEIAVNQDFTGNSVHPQGFPGQEPPKSQSFFPQASEMAKALAAGASRMTGGDGSWVPGMLEMHPDDLDHLAGSYTGGLGRFVGQAWNLMGFGLDPQSKAIQGKELRDRDIPIWRAFSGNVSDSSVRGNYDNLITPYLQIGKSFKDREEQGNIEAVNAMIQRDGNRLFIAQAVAEFERERIKTRRQISEIQKDPMLDDATKVQIIKQLRDEEQMLMNMAIRDIKNLEKGLGL